MYQQVYNLQLSRMIYTAICEYGTITCFTFACNKASGLWLNVPVNIFSNTGTEPTRPGHQPVVHGIKSVSLTDTYYIAIIFSSCPVDEQVFQKRAIFKHRSVSIICDHPL